MNPIVYVALAAAWLSMAVLEISTGRASFSIPWFMMAALYLFMLPEGLRNHRRRKILDRMQEVILLLVELREKQTPCEDCGLPPTVQDGEKFLALRAEADRLEADYRKLSGGVKGSTGP